MFSVKALFTVNCNLYFVLCEREVNMENIRLRKTVFVINSNVKMKKSGTKNILEKYFD